VHRNRLDSRSAQTTARGEKFIPRPRPLGRRRTYAGNVEQRPIVIKNHRRFKRTECVQAAVDGALFAHGREEILELTAVEPGIQRREEICIHVARDERTVEVECIRQIVGGGGDRDFFVVLKIGEKVQ